MDLALPQLTLKRIGIWRRRALLRLAMISAFSCTPGKITLALIDDAA